MLEIRKSGERGFFDHGWLKTHHTFSFDQYRDPRFDGFSVLRVINEDIIAEAEGFPTHGHRDMEIVTYVISGAIEHQDTLGNKTIIRPGEIQRMTAGSGIKHSEFNHLQNEPTHILQIWLLPQKRNEEPGYDQKKYSQIGAESGLLLIASSDSDKTNKTEGPIFLHQDVEIYVSKPSTGKIVTAALKEGRRAWLQLIEGQLEVLGHTLNAGDGLAISKENEIQIKSIQKAHFLFFDLP
jgi:redox-sensitive bicupin YhaK (pirin superfamily)